MKLPFHNTSRRGFTMLEMVITVGVLSVTGAIIFEALNTGMIMFAKNTAINASHQEGRKGVNWLIRDIHAAVSVPELMDANLNQIDNQPLDSNGNPTGTAGVMFQVVVSGPNYVFQDPGNAYLIMINDYKNSLPQKAPIPGQRLIVPFWKIESDIVKVGAAGSANHSNVWMSDAAETRIHPNNGVYNASVYAITYYTERRCYVVQNGGLHLYRQRYNSSTSSNYWVEAVENANGTLVPYGPIVRNVTSPTPFTTPLNSSGTPDTRYVGVRLTAADAGATIRGYRSTSTLLNTAIPYRSRICNFQ
jgi:prepilin-type N-terminal cleavage/methylation domain-containing protein